MIKKPIKINDWARVNIEDNNYTMEYRVKTGTFPGKEQVNEWKWVNGGYFPTAGTALADFMANAPVYSPEELKTFKDLVKCIEDAQARMVELLKG